MKTAQQIAEFLGGTLKGDAEQQIHTVGSLERAGDGALAYAEGPFLERVPDATASCVLVPSGDFPGRTVVVVDEPRLAFARATRWLMPVQTPQAGVHPSAIVHTDADVAPDASVGAWTYIEAGARVGSGSAIYPGGYVGRDCQIGAGCILYPRVVLYPGVRLGDRVIIHAGTVLGADGFGFVPDGARYEKVPQVGTVIIGSDVDIGSNTCVDRGALDDTVISDGAKIDNLCQIAHNVRVGSHAIISSQSGVAGSSEIGSQATIGGQVGVADHCRIGDRAILGAHTGIPSKKRIPDDAVYWGSPARPLKEGKLLQAYFSRLPKMSDEIKQLRAEVERLKAKLVD